MPYSANTLISSPRLVACALALAAGACVPGPDGPDGTEPVTETTQDLTTVSIVTTRPLVLTASTLADWNSDKQISPTIVANNTLKLRYCAYHFPAGSQALANLTTAINAYSGAAGVAINVTDIAAAAGTSSHPNLSTFTLPANAIYVDYDNIGAGAYASTALPSASCDASSPKRCTQARIYVTDTAPGFTNPTVVSDASSVGVFVHELGHVFGMKHINEDDDSVAQLNPSAMAFTRTTVHGNKTQADDFRGNVIQAGTLGFLRTYYAATGATTLGTDEIVAHRNMSMVSGTTHIEWNPSKSYGGWGTAGALIADKNETKLRWNPAADVGTGVPGGFEPCTAAGTVPRWYAQMSETSTNTIDKLFQAVFEVSNNDLATTWTQVATHTFDSYVAGQADFRQIEWEKTFALSAAAFGLPGGAGITASTTRKLRFRADASNALAERNEVNNEWQVNLCLYPASNTTCQNASVVCAQP